MVVDRNSPIPLYYQLKLYFKQQMESGELRAGDRLPTEMELCRRFNISRAPVRQALTELAREGLIYRRAGQGTFVAPTAAENLRRKTTLRVLAHYDVRWMSSLESAVHHWNQAHPKQEIQIEVTMCSRDDFHRVLRHAVAQGNAPDIVPLDYVWVRDYAHAGYLSELGALDGAWTRDFLADMEPPVARSNTVDGRLYGVPIQADITGLWYRKDWFRQEGVKPPETWSEWLALMDHFADPEVKARLGYQYTVVLPVTALAGEATVNLLLPFIWMTGGGVVSAEGELTLDAPPTYEALHFLQEITLRRRSYLPDSVAHSRWWDLVRFLALGTVPMALGGTYEWPRIRDESAWVETEEEAMSTLGFVLAPRPSEDVPPVGSLGGTSWAILRQSASQELGMELLKVAASPHMLARFCEENLQVSPRREVNQRLTASEHRWFREIVPLFSWVRTRPLVPNYIQISRFLQKMFEQVLWVGEVVEETVRRTAQSLALLMET